MTHVVQHTFTIIDLSGHLETHHHQIGHDRAARLPAELISSVRDRENYEKWAGQAGAPVCWFDITGQEERLLELGIDPRRALTELHVLDEHRRIRSELDAYILLMERVPCLKPLAWLIGRPLIRPWLARLYHRTVKRRLRQSGRLE